MQKKKTCTKFSSTYQYISRWRPIKIKLNPGGRGLPIKSDGGSECWALPLTLKYKKNNPNFDNPEYNLCKTEAPEV